MLTTILLALAPLAAPGTIGVVQPSCVHADLGDPDLATQKAANPRLNEVQTRSLVGQYNNAPHWSMRALVLLSLGPDWHPFGAPMVLKALQDEDTRLRAYALEVLTRTDAKALRASASTELVENLVAVQLKHEHEAWRLQAVGILTGLFPKTVAREPEAWTAYWDEIGRTFVPLEWKEPKAKRGDRSVVGGAATRAMDLYSAGLEVAICIDTTSSMQSMIDACTLVFEDVVFLLNAVAPDFKIGLVHYKDVDSNPKGGAVIAGLSKNTATVRRKLAALKVKGGGDTPEAVEDGLAKALSTRMGWSESTAKLVLLVGDAPPHKGDLETAVEMAREAHEKPFGKRPGKDQGSRGKVRPFVVAGIGVGSSFVTQDTRYAFHEIARAGGGSYIDFTTSRKEKDKDLADRAMRTELTSGVLELVFGSRFREELIVFVNVYMKWSTRGLFTGPADEAPPKRRR